MTDAAGVAWPTVIIGGAPRCGTSSLFDLLQGTRAFARRRRKELFLLNDPDFWIQGATPGYAAVGERCYELAAFQSGERFIDASTTYLYQSTAPAACARRLSAEPARPFLAVFCLREPAERLYSSFLYFRDVLLRMPAETTFTAYADALLAGRSRSGNQQVDAALEHGNYPPYLQAWRDAVGEQRVLVVRTEALAGEAQAVVAAIGARIGVPLAAGADGRRNAGYQPRFRYLHALARRLGGALPHGALRERLKAAYVRAIPKEAGEKLRPEDEDTLRRVRDYYRARAPQFAACGLDWYGPA